MSMKKISDDDLRIHVHHIGGIGDCGPTEAIRMLGDDVEWTVYDADEGALSKMGGTLGKNISLVNKCIGGANTKKRFNIMRGQSASSLLTCSPEAKSYTLITGSNKAQIWGIHTQVTKSIEMELVTIDSLAGGGKIGGVDFLSIDAQGAELDIINGASKLLHDNIVGVLCETAFSEIYSGQPLFCDIQERLKNDGFRLCRIYNNQHWNTCPLPEGLMGEGFTIVGESLFLKDQDKIIEYGGISLLGPELLTKDIIRCLKLAAIAVVFDQLDFALKITMALEENKLVSLDELAEVTNIRYIKLLRDLMAAATELKKESPALAYQSSYSLDYEKCIDHGHPNLVYKIRRLFRILLPPLLIFLIKKLISNTRRERSRITKIYKRYGLTNLIRNQSFRLWWS